jgi:hypothetical protein
MIFSFISLNLSIFPEVDASTRTLTVSWNDEAESQESV